MLTHFILTATLLLLSTFAPADAQPAPSGPDISMLKQLINDETLSEFKSVKAVPKSVRDEFGKLTQNSFFMADPEKNFAIGCVRSGDLPSRRLILGAVNSKYGLLFYEKGGYAHQYLIAVFELNATTSKLLLKAAPSLTSAKKVKTISELKQLIKSGTSSEASYL